MLIGIILLFVLIHIMLTERTHKAQAKLTSTLQNEFRQNREETSKDRALLQQDLQGTADLQKAFLVDIPVKLEALRKSNEEKLEKIRFTVDQKLQSELEKRLGTSFERVNNQLVQVHQGLGEMKELAASVGSLKNMLSNVKIRGTWGEVQLGGLLEQVMTPDQFAKNVKVNPTKDNMVDFAIRLPGKTMEGADNPIWLPIDAKFPQEDFIRIQEAALAADQEALKKAQKQLEATLRKAAQDIKDKYICAPYTTDFAVMFLATEGLFAEALRLPNLLTDLQVQHQIVVASPTTLAALLNSLNVGFQTLRVERRANEIQRALGEVKTEFSKFGVTLSKVKKNLIAASNSIDSTATRTRAMERKLLAAESWDAIDKIENVDIASVLDDEAS